MEFIENMNSQNLSYNTIKSHTRNINTIEPFMNSNPNEQQIIDHINETKKTLSTRKAYASTFSKYLKFLDKDNKFIHTYLANINKELSKVHLERTKRLSVNAPQYFELTAKMEQYFKDKKYREYVVMFLLLNYGVRNQDLICHVTNKNDTINDKENYFIKNPAYIIWVRNVYKTSDKYGTKRIRIVNHSFIEAIYNIDYVLKPNDNIDRIIKKITGGVTESTICKIILETKTSINAIDDLSKSRGTSIETLKNSYNFNLQNEE